MNIIDRMKSRTPALIKRNGREWTITSTTGAATSTTRPAWMAPDKTVTHLLGDSGVDIGDKMMICEPGANPKEGERASFASESYVIIAVEQVPPAPASDVLMWAVALRAG